MPNRLIYSLRHVDTLKNPRTVSLAIDLLVTALNVTVLWQVRNRPGQ